MPRDVAGSSALLSLSGVSAGYKKVPSVQDLSLHLPCGSATAIIGANGAGKSTMLRAVMGEIPLMSGSVTFDGRNISRLATHERSRLGIGYVPEGRHLFPAMTVLENLEVGGARLDRGDRIDQIERALALFPKLRPLVRRDCGYLSGGEQQMVTIARALMSRPRLLVLDEPSTGLAPRIIGELYASLRSLLPSGLTILLAEQNARAAMRFAQQAIVLEGGRIVAAGPAADLSADRRVIDAYVGVTAIA